MSDDTERAIADYYRSITPGNAERIPGLVADSIEARRRRGSARRGLWQLGGAVGIATVLAFAVLGAPMVLGPSASPDLSLSPVASAPIQSASPAVSGSPTPVAPTVSPGPTAVISGSWIRIATAGGGPGASWSPDGQYLAMWTMPDFGPSRDMKLLNRHGNLIRPLDGDKIFWIDDTRFVLLKSGSASLGSVDSASLTPVSQSFAGAEVLSNGHGALALSSADPANPEMDNFVVWTPNEVTETVEGEAAAWSIDGTQLAIWHPKPVFGQTGTGFQNTGHITVVAWPSLSPVATVPGTDLVPYGTAFDHSGRYLLVPHLGLGGSFVFDLQAGTTVGPKKIDGQAFWDSNDAIRALSSDGSLRTYRLDSSTVTTERGIGDSGGSSSDGSTIVFYFMQDYTGSHSITLIRNGTTMSLDVPGGLEEKPVLSANGAGVAIICLIDFGKSSYHIELLLLNG